MKALPEAPLPPVTLADHCRRIAGIKSEAKSAAARENWKKAQASGKLGRPKKLPVDQSEALEKAADAARTHVSAYSPKRRAKLSKVAQEVTK